MFNFPFEGCRERIRDSGQMSCRRDEVRKVTKMRTLSKLALGAAALVVAAPAMSAVTVNFYPDGTGAPSYTDLYADFDGTNGTLSAGTSPTDYVIQSGDNADGAEPDVGDQGDNYFSVVANGTATFDFGANIGSIAFDYGSADNYNTITIVTNLDTYVYTGTQVIDTPPADGDQSADRTNGVAVFTAGSGEYITNLTLQSSVNSLEIDNIRTLEVPEPGTWMMMLLGFGTMGLAIRNRRRRGLGQFSLRQLV